MTANGEMQMDGHRWRDRRAVKCAHLSSAPSRRVRALSLGLFRASRLRGLQSTNVPLMTLATLVSRSRAVAHLWQDASSILLHRILSCESVVRILGHPGSRIEARILNRCLRGFLGCSEAEREREILTGKSSKRNQNRERKKEGRKERERERGGEGRDGEGRSRAAGLRPSAAIMRPFLQERGRSPCQPRPITSRLNLTASIIRHHRSSRQLMNS